MIKNACAVLLTSRGTPMFLAGDEFGNTQFGNNNAYCQDNQISWLDWGNLEKYQDIYDFFRYLIRFRKMHPAIAGSCKEARCGLPEVRPSFPESLGGRLRRPGRAGGSHVCRI